MKLNISEPILISMGPDSRTAGWGPYQFPDLRVLEDGRLFCAFNDRLDSAAVYGMERPCFVSSDRGQTWTRVKESDYDIENSLTIANGDKLRFDEQKTMPLGDADPSFFLSADHAEPVVHKNEVYYRTEDIRPEVCPNTWLLHRVKKGENKATIEPVKLNWPHMLTYTTRGILVPPQPQCRLRMGPDGRLWLPHYAIGCDPQTGEFNEYSANYLFCSADNGHTWDLKHYLAFTPKGEDETARDGYSENDIGFAPDGSLIQLIRTRGTYPRTEKPCTYSPTRIVRSTDGGETWSEPEYFDDRGVWPTLLSLKCGVTLAGYGRPGFFIRASFDPACKKWEDRIEIVHSSGGPEHVVGCVHTKATCSYCDMAAIDDRTAGLVYSDFTIEDDEGNPRKCIMFRTITVED